VLLNLKCNASDPPLPRSIPRPLAGTASSERGSYSYRRNDALPGQEFYVSELDFKELVATNLLLNFRKALNS
jgi:hypothetical protein